MLVCYCCCLLSNRCALSVVWPTFFICLQGVSFVFVATVVATYIHTCTFSYCRDAYAYWRWERSGYERVVFCYIFILSINFKLYMKILNSSERFNFRFSYLQGIMENPSCTTIPPDTISAMLWTIGAVFGIVYALLGEYNMAM